MTTTSLKTVYIRSWACSIGASAAAFYTVSELYVCDVCAMSFTRELHYHIHRLQSCGLRTATPPEGNEVYSGPCLRRCPGGEILGPPKKGRVGKKTAVDSGASGGQSEVLVVELAGSNVAHAAMIRRSLDLFRLFLETKLNVQEIEDLLVFLLYQVEGDGSLHLAGFFSRGARGTISPWSLMCIAVLPPYRGFGYGSFLMHLSYDLLVKERMTGTPEKPLTVSGIVLSRAVWRQRVNYFLNVAKREHETKSSSGAPMTVTVESIAQATGLDPEDVEETLLENRYLPELAALRRGKRGVAPEDRRQEGASYDDCDPRENGKELLVVCEPINMDSSQEALLRYHAALRWAPPRPLMNPQQQGHDDHETCGCDKNGHSTGKCMC